MERLHFEVEGGARAPTLVLIHGFMSSRHQWSLNRERLSEHFRLVSVELWGHGRSPSPTDPQAYRVERYLDELEHIRRSVGVERWLVCGQSFGAGLAIRYALAHPKQVAGLIVTNSRSALNDVSREGRASGDADTWRRMDLRALPLHPCHARRFPAELKARMEAAADAVDRDALRQAATTTARALSCRDVVHELSVPTLLVNGRFEKRFQPDRDFAKARIPGIEVVDLDAGHSVNIEAAPGFDEAVIDFARRHAFLTRLAP
jgi:2-succinyl-6-hydroxy-2,4-cyclohexadiene-1-carboxylate synthase